MYIIAKYKASNCCKIEAVIQRYLANLAQVFSCKYCEIFQSTFLYRTLPVAASGGNWNQVSEISKISVPAIFNYTWHHGLPLHCDKIVIKRDIHRKNICDVHLYCNSNFKTSKHLNENKNRWCIEIAFWMIWVLRTRLYNFLKKKTVWQFHVRSHMTQDLGDTRLF